MLIFPGLITSNSLLRIFTRVDSSPTLHLPPSIMNKLVSLNCSATIFALIGLNFLNLFAEGITKGEPIFFITSIVKSFLGILTAQSLFRVSDFGILSDFLFKIKVIGPGQNLLAKISFF